MIGNLRRWGRQPLSRLSLIAAMPLLCSSMAARAAQVEDSIDRRIDLLLSQMTLEEKAGQLTQFSLGTPTGPGTTRYGYEEMVRKFVAKAASPGDGRSDTSAGP
jgi:hypothetical protein